MKVTIQKEKGAAPELIIRCEELDDEILKLLQWLEQKEEAVIVRNGLVTKRIKPEKILYCEAVERKLFVYTQSSVEEADYTLIQLEEKFSMVGFFRCSKSMIINIHQIKHLQSGRSGQLIATLINDEQLVISRHYGKLLRKKLLEKGV